LSAASASLTAAWASASAFASWGFVALVPGVGVVVGGIAAWLRQHKWRMRARRAEAEARDLRSRLDADQPRRNLPALEASPPFAVPPAA